ncbi:hypothetical protein TRVL_09584 [Trypanosoma vivax]|nr:hypothetical protein TRVL_09584 [Trypanosoma vivax]
MRLRVLEHIAPHRIEAPQGLVTEAALRPLQWQRPHIRLLQRQSLPLLLSDHSGNTSASQKAVPIKGGLGALPLQMAFGGAQGSSAMPRESSTRGPSTSRSCSKRQPSVPGTARRRMAALVDPRVSPAASELSGPNRVRSPPRLRAPARPVILNAPSWRKVARFFPKRARQAPGAAPHPPFLQ